MIDFALVLWKDNTCPICERTFKVTPTDDVFIPVCGCYDDAEPGHLPCEECGLKHIYAHDNREPPARRFTAIIDGEGALIASAEGKEDGDALAQEFIVEQ